MVDKGISPKYTHIYASSGLLNYDINCSNLVRIELMLYGYYPGKNRKIALKPL